MSYLTGGVGVVYSHQYGTGVEARVDLKLPQLPLLQLSNRVSASLKSEGVDGDWFYREDHDIAIFGSYGINIEGKFKTVLAYNPELQLVTPPEWSVSKHGFVPHVGAGVSLRRETTHTLDKDYAFSSFFLLPVWPYSHGKSEESTEGYVDATLSLGFDYAPPKLKHFRVSGNLSYNVSQEKFDASIALGATF